MNKWLIAVMVVAAVVMIWGLTKQKAGAEWGKPVATLAAIVALVCALAQIFSGQGPSQKSVMSAQLKYLSTSTEVLGQHLAEKYAGKKVLIIVPPTSKFAQENNSALIDGLKKGMGDKLTIVAEVAPEVPKNMPGMMPPPMMPPPVAGKDGKPGEVPPQPTAEDMLLMGPIEFWLTPERFDAMLRPYMAKVDIVITTIGLPMEVAKLQFWNASPRPTMVIATGSIFELKKAIEGKAVVAAVTYNPKAVYDNKMPPAKLQEAFDKRFVLVTSENVGEVSKKFPELFMNR